MRYLAPFEIPSTLVETRKGTLERTLKGDSRHLADFDGIIAGQLLLQELGHASQTLRLYLTGQRT